MTNVLNLQRDAILITNVEEHEQEQDDMEEQEQRNEDVERQEQRHVNYAVKIEFSNFKCSEIFKLDI